MLLHADVETSFLAARVLLHGVFLLPELPSFTVERHDCLSGIFLTILQYKISRKMKMLQEYWASTVIFIGIFSQCNFTRFKLFLVELELCRPSQCWLKLTNCWNNLCYYWNWRWGNARLCSKNGKNSTLRYECDETFSDECELSRKRFFARVLYEILYHEVWKCGFPHAKRA